MKDLCFGNRYQNLEESKFKEASTTWYVGKRKKSSLGKAVFKSSVTIGRPSGYGLLMQELSPFTFVPDVRQYVVFDGPVGY
jgi:hypothetical protein